MAETQAMQDALLTAFTALATHATVFDADPGRTGAVTGEVATARVALVWSAPVSVGAARQVTATAIIPISASSTVNYTGVCASGAVGAADLLDSASTTTFSAGPAPSSYTATIVRSEP
jgi:hypothetical protein